MSHIYPILAMVRNFLPTLAFSKLISFSWRLYSSYFSIFVALFILGPLSRISFPHSHLLLHVTVNLRIQSKCRFLHEAFSIALWHSDISFLNLDHSSLRIPFYNKPFSTSCSDFWSSHASHGQEWVLLCFTFHLHTSSLFEWILKLVLNIIGSCCFWFSHIFIASQPFGKGQV